jgi:MFS family permease
MFKFTPYTTTLGLSGLSLNFAVAFIATCAFWLFGYDMSVMGGIITEPAFTSVFPSMNDATIQGIVIASFELGALVGALSCLDLGDRLGRRSTVWVGMTFMLVGGALQCSAWHVSQLTVGRVISGIGLGLQVSRANLLMCLPSLTPEHRLPPSHHGNRNVQSPTAEDAGVSHNQALAQGLSLTFASND